jgi:hypothetical protein
VFVFCVLDGTSENYAGLIDSFIEAWDMVRDSLPNYGNFVAIPYQYIIMTFLF